MPRFCEGLGELSGSQASRKVDRSRRNSLFSDISNDIRITIARRPFTQSFCVSKICKILISKFSMIQRHLASVAS